MYEKNIVTVSATFVTNVNCVRLVCVCVCMYVCVCVCKVYVYTVYVHMHVGMHREHQVSCSVTFYLLSLDRVTQ